MRIIGKDVMDAIRQNCYKVYHNIDEFVLFNNCLQTAIEEVNEQYPDELNMWAFYKGIQYYLKMNNIDIDWSELAAIDGENCNVFFPLIERTPIFMETMAPYVVNATPFNIIRCCRGEIPYAGYDEEGNPKVWIFSDCEVQNILSQNHQQLRVEDITETQKENQTLENNEGNK